MRLKKLFYKDLKNKVIHKLGYQKVTLKGINRENFLDLFFEIHTPFVVQIGTNDGKTHDPLFNYISRQDTPCLLVEPQPDIFEKLKANYAGKENIKFANVAIGEKDGETNFYRIKPELVKAGREYKASSGSSFDRSQIITNVINRLPPRTDKILRHISDDPEDYIQEIKVPTLTLDTLFERYGVEKIDLFFTDCQGFDFKILRQFDFKKYTPTIINYEHALLTTKEFNEGHELLKSRGYKYFMHEGDTCAYKQVQ